MLAIMNKHPGSMSASAANSQLQGAHFLAQQLQQWQHMEKLASSLTSLLLNLMEQLGALCAAQTRKSTILQGL